MKEAYFTEEGIQQAADEMLAALPKKGKTRRLTFAPQRAALLILDMQDYFLQAGSHAYIPSAAAILPLLIRLQEQFLQHHRPVFLTRHLNTEENAGNMKTWWRDLITAHHPQGRISATFLDREVELLTKTQYDAFFETDLEDQLRARDVTQVLIGGVMTHLCCETTARSAFVRGFEVFFLVDGTATYQRAYHIATLRNLDHGFATLVKTTDIERVIRDSGT